MGKLESQFVGEQLTGKGHHILGSHRQESRVLLLVTGLIKDGRQDGRRHTTRQDMSSLSNRHGNVHLARRRSGIRSSRRRRKGLKKLVAFPRKQKGHFKSIRRVVVVAVGFGTRFGGSRWRRTRIGVLQGLNLIVPKGIVEGSRGPQQRNGGWWSWSGSFQFGACHRQGFGNADPIGDNANPFPTRIPTFILGHAKRLNRVANLQSIQVATGATIGVDLEGDIKFLFRRQSQGTHAIGFGFVVRNDQFDHIAMVQADLRMGNDFFTTTVVLVLLVVVVVVWIDSGGNGKGEGMDGQVRVGRFHHGDFAKEPSGPSGNGRLGGGGGGGCLGGDWHRVGSGGGHVIGGCRGRVHDRKRKRRRRRCRRCRQAVVVVVSILYPI